MHVESKTYRVLITGANSYIGTSFENWIKANCRDVITKTIDLRKDSWQEESFSGYDAVFHVAGIAHADVGGASEEQKALYYQVNTELTARCAEKAKTDGVGQFIFMSSMIVYGESAGIGTARMITRDTAAVPANFYGDSKLKAELTAAIAAAKTEMANAISALAENVDKAKNELSRALADGDSALLDKIKALSATLDALDEAYQAADREQDVSTERMTEEAKEVLNTANAVLAQRLDSVERRLDGLTAVTAAAVGVLVLFDAAALVLFFVWKKKKGL